LQRNYDQLLNSNSEAKSKIINDYE
jgi:hypothetical protein